MEPKSRTFQSPEKTLRQVAKLVLADYSVSLQIEKDITIEQMLSQQKETDWHFLRRIANQFGMMLFTDIKSSRLKIHIGAVPFCNKELTLENAYGVRDIAAFWNVKQNVRKSASAYEFLQTGGRTADLTVGSGCLVAGGKAPQVVTGSEILSERGVLHNDILLTYVDGAVPSSAAAEGGKIFCTGSGEGNSAVSFVGVLTGKVSSVCDTDIEVDFEGDQSGKRWIPYTSPLGNDIYAMPDEKDEVFCYFDNSGEVVALGSKVKDTSHPDFRNPMERSLTACNRMIKLKEDGIDLTANRTEYDGGEGCQVKITFSDTEGIEIAATGDITINGKEGAGGILLQAKELPEDRTKLTEWFETKFSQRMEAFWAQQDAGKDQYVADGGKNYLFNENRELFNDFLENIKEGAKNEVFSYGRFIKTIQGLVEKPSEPEKTEFEHVEDKRVSLIAMEKLDIRVGNTGLVIGKGYIMLGGPVFQQSGFNRKKDYPQVSESQRTWTDLILDGVNLVIDVACLVCPTMYAFKLISASIYLMRGDYYNALTSLIPFGGIGKAASALAKGKDIADAIFFVRKVMAGVQMFNAAVDYVAADYRFHKALYEDGLAALGEVETWDYLLTMGRSRFAMAANAKEIGEINEAARASKQPEGNENKGNEGQGTEQQGNAVKDENVVVEIDPVDVVTGSQKITQAELVIKDVTGDFVLQRHYESIYKNSGSMLGERWFLNVGSYLSIQGDKVTILLPNRHLERFQRGINGDWENLRGGDGSVTLTEKNREYLLLRKKEEKLYRYDFAGKLTAIEDRNGNTIRLKYMGAVLVEVDFPSDQMLSFRYEADKLSCITDSIGREIRYRYEGELLTEVVYPNGATIIYTYTPEGYIESVTDQNGNQFVHNDYSMDGRVTRQLTIGGLENVILYDDNRRVNTILNMTNDDRQEYHYNKDKLLVKTIYSDGSSEEIRYDERENKTWKKDRRGGELICRFNEDSLLVEKQLPSRLITCYEYDRNGRLTGSWDNAGSSQQFKYDSHGNPVEICRTISEGIVQKVQFSYDLLGRTLETTDSNGNVTRYAYEGRCPLPCMVTTPEGDVFRYSYDRAGRCMEVTAKQGTTRYAYNHMNHTAMVTNPLGETTKYYYDGLCNLTKVVKPNQTGKDGGNRGTEYVYDAMNDLIMTIDALGNVHATPRDMTGNIRKEISPNTYDPATGDGDGILYEYDVFNRRTKIRYPDGGVERIRYDAAGNIIQKISPSRYDEAVDNGAGWSYEYDMANRLVQITDPAGMVQKRYVYDLHGNVIKLITAKGYLMGENDEERVGELYSYNCLGWLTEARKPIKEEDGVVLYQLIQYHYDMAGNLVKELRYRDYQTKDSEKGVVHTIAYEYDRNHRLVRVSDCTGAAVEYCYNDANQRTMERRRINDDVEQVFVYIYDGAGRLTEVRESADETGCGRKASVTKYTYDHNGNLTRINLPYGAEIHREYDAVDRLTAEIHLEKKTGIHNTTRFTYDKAGNLTQITDNLGRTVHMEYDLLNREERRTEKDGGITRTLYDMDGRTVKVIRPREYERAGEKSYGEQYAYDLSGRLLSVTRADGVVGEAHTYDESGRIICTIDGTGNGVHFTYDLGGRRTYAETDGGASQQYEYDAFGNITGIVDGESNRTRYVLDEWGRIVEVKRADGVSEFYRYDYAGNITRSVDGNGNATSYEYNRAGKLSRMTDPMGYSEEYHYDLGNRLCRMTDRNGTEVSYTYNLYGNLLGRKAGDLLESFEYTAEGLLKSAISQGMRYGYEYDVMGRLARKTASGRTLLSYAYDLNGNLTRQEDVTGKITEYQYNAVDFLEKVTDNGIVMAEYGYYPDSTIRSLHSGSLHTEYTYDADRNLTGLKTTLEERVLADNHYSYDHNGSRTQKQQLSGTTRYTYDALNRLAKVEYPSYTEELFYDRSGNRSRRLANGAEEIYQYDPRNRLTEYIKGGMCTKYEYDNAGNLLADDRARYAYDAFNRTQRAETFDGHVQVNHYDAEGLRHELEEDGKLVQFIFRGDKVVAEKTDDNIIRLIRGYDLTASEADWARTYYHYASDEMGSTTHVVENAEVKNRYEYDAWGNLTDCEETVENRFKFNGQQYDPITQQYYLRARFYNPVIARFTQEDTYRGDGLNLYAYCRNNPVSYVDPTGHWCDLMERVYQGLLKEEGLTADSVDPDTQLQLMAKAANLVKGKIPLPSETGEGNLRTNPDFYVTSDGQTIPAAAYNLPAFDGKTTNAVLVTLDGRVLARFESGDKDLRYVNYANDGHTEQKAAMYMQEHGITEAVLYHNNDGGTCGWCRTMTNTFLPEGYSLTVVPPINAVAANTKAITYSMTFIGNSNLPKISRRYKFKH